MSHHADLATKVVDLSISIFLTLLAVVKGSIPDKLANAPTLSKFFTGLALDGSPLPNEAKLRLWSGQSHMALWTWLRISMQRCCTSVQTTRFGLGLGLALLLGRR